MIAEFVRPYFFQIRADEFADRNKGNIRMKRYCSALKRRLNIIRKTSYVRLFVIVITIVIIPIAFITIYSFNFTINQARSRYEYSLTIGTQQIANTLSADLGNLLSLGKIIIADDDLKNTLNAYKSGTLALETAENKLNLLVQNYENTAFVSTLFTPKIAIVTRENQIFGSKLAGDVLNKQEFHREIVELYGTNRNVKWLCDAKLFASDAPTYEDCLHLLLAVRDSQTFRTIATVVLQVRTNVLTSRILPNMFSYQSAIVMDGDGNCVVKLDYLDIADQMNQWVNGDNIEILRNQMLGAFMNDMECVITNYPLTRTDWYLIMVSSMEDYAALKQVYLRNFILAGGIIIILSFLVTYWFSKRFMKPVMDLNNHMKLVKEGNLNVRLTPSSDDEIGELTWQFNEMVAHIEHLIELNRIKEEEKRISDIRFLQTQINPHFIYNTLTLLRYSVLTSDKNQADSIILALNNILRYAFSDSKQYVTLNRALGWIRNYVVIVNCSLKEDVEVIFDMDEDTGNCQIMRMLIQPLVENAAFHGLKNCEMHPKLEISAWIEQNNLYIRIWDNGPGFDTDQLRKEKCDLDRRSIGVENVDQRIRLYYGDKYGLKYRSYKEGLPLGTEAILTLPVIRKEEGDVLINEYSDRG